MIVKEDPKELITEMVDIRQKLEHVIEKYLEEYADYGWDSFSETMATAAAQIFMQEMILKNAEMGDKDV